MGSPGKGPRGRMVFIQAVLKANYRSDEFRRARVGTQVRAGSHEGLECGRARGRRREGRNLGDRIYMAPWATEVGPVAESHTGDCGDLSKAGRKTGVFVRKELCSVVR